MKLLLVNQRLVFSILGLFLLGLSLPVQAHNGALAIAVPVEGIKVDGDLSDWPAGMRWYPISLQESGDRLKGPEDFHGSFRLGYDTQEHALYVGVEVQDESVLEGSGDANIKDGCEVFLAVDHQEGEERPAQWVLWGNRRETFGSGKSEDVRVEARKVAGGSVYEWRLDLRRFSDEPGPIRRAIAIGFDVVVQDNDADGSFTWMAWGRGTNKVDSSDRLGDVVLIPADQAPGRMVGRVRWEGQEEGVTYGKVRIQALSPEDLRVETTTDYQGNFTVDLPAGSYRLMALRQEWIVEVGTGQEARVDLQVSPLQGLRVEAGKGRAVLAGSGIRRGPWQSFGIGDGLPSASVGALAVDRQGRLWLGTGRIVSDQEQGAGVVCYDGAQFVVYTTAEGLAGNTVLGIAEDAAGNLWFGTGGQGVSRYDGQHFTTFTVVDGLAGDWIYAVLADRQGRVWFGTQAGVSCYERQRFKTFTTEEGLASDQVVSMAQDTQGNLWFGTLQRGVSRYDGQHFTTFTSQDGLGGNCVWSIAEDGQGSLWFGGWDSGVSRYDGRSITAFSTRDGLTDTGVRPLLADRQGHLWAGAWTGVNRYDGQTWAAFSAVDGLKSTIALAMVEDREGGVWFGAMGGGLSRYDDKHLLTLTVRDGMPSDNLRSILEDRRGNLWFCTYSDKSLFRYDGKTWTPFTTADGLAASNVFSMLEDRQGLLWFGTLGSGVSQYDGQHFKTFTTADDLENPWIRSMLEDRQGQLWFGTWGRIIRYDGQQFKTLTADGLADIRVNTMLEDRQGLLWFGTWSQGVSWYDGQQFKTFTTANGLAGNRVVSMLEDRQGLLWFGTWGGGVSRYDGRQFKTFTTQDGLTHNSVEAILEDRRGHLWFGTWGGGVTHYDGQVFQRFLQEDGLASDAVHGLTQVRNGDIWIATEGGATRYRPAQTPPAISLTNVTAEHPYGPVPQLRLSSSQDYLRFDFQGASLQTPPKRMMYVYRLEGYEEAWHPTHDSWAEYQDLPLGAYTFQVKAVDRDLTYSETPATVKVAIYPPYGQIALVGGLGLSLVGLVFASGMAMRRRRAFLQEQQARLQAQEQLNRELEEELQTAHNLQMDLMPRESPQLAGLELAGRCIPANHVGGDFFQYFPQEGKLTLCLADVTGHAMEAAIPMVMFSGVLHSEMRHQLPLEQLFANLNHTLHARLDARTFVCFSMAQLDLPARTLRLANGGCPYPYHYRAADQQVVELRLDTYPLGVRSDTHYQTIEVDLAPGDYVVFCSDGIIEAVNTAGEVFGYERTAEVVRSRCVEGLSAAELLERLFAAVRDFSAGTAQQDDQTIVVVKLALPSAAHP